MLKASPYRWFCHVAQSFSLFVAVFLSCISKHIPYLLPLSCRVSCTLLQHAMHQTVVRNKNNCCATPAALTGRSTAIDKWNHGLWIASGTLREQQRNPFERRLKGRQLPLRSLPTSQCVVFSWYTFPVCRIKPTRLSEHSSFLVGNNLPTCRQTWLVGHCVSSICTSPYNQYNWLTNDIPSSLMGVLVYMQDPIPNVVAMAVSTESMSCTMNFHLFLFIISWS